MNRQTRYQMALERFRKGHLFIDSGTHPGVGTEGCVMEWTAVLAGLKKTDHPSCTNRIVTAAAIYVNDSLPMGERQRLLPFIPRLLRAKQTTQDGRINVQLLYWAAQRIGEGLKCKACKGFHDRILANAEEWLRRGTCNEDEVTDILDGDYRHLSAADVLGQALLNRLHPRKYVFPLELHEVLYSFVKNGEDEVLWLSDLLDVHEKILAEAGLLWEENDFCAFADALSESTPT